MKTVDFIARALVREGVEFVACFPHNELIDACARAGIRPIVCRQERVALAMADGFSRATDGVRPGVFICQHGPGAENAFAGVAQAYSDNVPVLILPAGEPTFRQGVAPVFNACRNFEHITKWQSFVSSPERLAGTLRHAFFRLRTGKGGPVLVEVALDVLLGDVPESEHEPVRGARAAPDPRDVARAADALLAAERPVLYAGQGVLFGRATGQLVALAERLDAPVITTNSGKSAFPERHPLSLGASAISKPQHLLAFLEESDLVFGVGTSFTRTVYGTSVPAGKVMIQATNGEADVNKDYAVDHVLLGDVALALDMLLAELDTRGVDRRPGVNSGRALAAKRAFLERWSGELTSDETPINQYRVIGEMMRLFDPDNTVITHDAGTPREQLVSLWEATVPHGYLGWGKSTQLGFGLGAIMGAKLAFPERLCINVMGDSAIGMVATDIETAVRNRIGILTVVFNNGVMAIESRSLAYAHARYNANAQGGDYAALAASLGAWSRRVTEPRELAGALMTGAEAAQGGQAALVEVMVKQGYAWPGREGATEAL